ncbi:hypothetical protein Bbelb_155980 [Branchiostoma belcheri]|nr:hypothetical protein Bbelb_155980 [Branchiostoma belcheri]
MNTTCECETAGFNTDPPQGPPGPAAYANSGGGWGRSSRYQGGALTPSPWVDGIIHFYCGGHVCYVFLKTWGRSGVNARHSHGCARCKSVVCTPRLAVSGCVHRSLRKWASFTASGGTTSAFGRDTLGGGTSKQVVDL